MALDFLLWLFLWMLFKSLLSLTSMTEFAQGAWTACLTYFIHVLLLGILKK